jgi:hypothetical protein
MVPVDSALLQEAIGRFNAADPHRLKLSYTEGQLALIKEALA